MARDRFSEDLVLAIFTCLPAKSAIKFKCLSKYYNKTISDPSFGVNQALKSNPQVIGLFRSTNIDLEKVVYCHLDLQSEICQPNNYRSFCPIIAACNGLLLLVHSKSAFSVFNPTIDKYKIIPKSGYACASFKWNVGLAYDSIGFSSLDYKVVLVARTMIISPALESYIFEIFDFNTNSWRESRLRLEGQLGGFFKMKGNAVCLNGSLYWLRLCGDIIAYDVIEEKPKLISMPPLMKIGWHKHEDYTWFGAANGFLYLIYVNASGEVEMWILHDCENMEWGLVRILIKGLPERAYPVFFDGERLVFEYEQQNEKEICLYNLKLQKWKTLGKFSTTKDEISVYTPFIPSLAPNSVTDLFEDFQPMMLRRIRNRKRKPPQLVSHYNLRSKAKKKET